MILKDKFGKEISKKPGIYHFLCKLNDKSYIGKTIDKLLERINEHIDYQQQLIDKKIKEYGINNFEIEILAEYESGKVTNDELLALETAFIEYFDSLTRNYDNIKGKGYNVCLFSNDRTGISFTEEQKRNSSIAQKKLYENGYINPMKNKKHTIESKKKNSESQKQLYKNGYIHPLLGKNHSLKTKQKMSKNHANVKGKNNGRYNSNIYTFKNIKTNETFVGTKYDFRKNYNVSFTHLWQLTTNKIKHVKHWILI